MTTTITYTLRTPERLALAILATQPSGIRALLLEGPPGCGKTELARYHAEQTSADLVYGMLHAWTDDGELFAGVNVVAAVAGDAARVHQPGVIARAAQLSHHRPVVLCLDEIDKAPERVECLLLDVLQTGRVPVRPGEHLLADHRRLTVVITSNGVRDLSDALLRRVVRCRMQPLEPQQIDALLISRGHDRALVTMAGKTARLLAEAAGSAISLSEIERFVCSLCVPSTCDELREVLAQCCARDDRGRQVAHDRELQIGIAALWGELVARRRRAA